MTIQVPIVRDLEGEHRRAVDSVNRWRGRCIECFARIEQASLLALDELVALGKIPRPKSALLFGARIKALESALESEELRDRSKACREALAGLDTALARRNVIVHATGKVWIDHHGKWLWEYSFLGNTRQRVHDRGVIDFGEAEDLEKRLSAKARSLSDTLRNLARCVKD